MAYFKSNKEIRDAMDEDGYVEGEVIIDLDTVIDSDADEFYDILSDRLGISLLGDITYEIAGLPDDGSRNCLIIKVRGHVDDTDVYDEDEDDNMRFSMHGVGITRLEEKLAAMTVNAKFRAGDKEIIDNVMSALQNMYNELDYMRRQVVKFEQGMYDPANNEANAPGYVIYINPGMADAMGLSKEDAANHIYETLELCINNAGADGKAEAEILEDFRSHIGIMRSTLMPVKEIDIEGEFY